MQNKVFGSGVSVSEDTPEGFDPDSLVAVELPFRAKKRPTLGVQPILEPPLKIKKMAEEAAKQIYEETQSPAVTTTAIELSKNSAYPIAVLFLNVVDTDGVTIVGSLKGISMLHGGEFMHLDLELVINHLLPMLPKFENMNASLVKLEVSSKGETITTEYKKVKLKSVLCKDFTGAVTQCKLVFVRS
jgi:hypothetical protein